MEKILEDFKKVLDLAGVKEHIDIAIEILPAPHKSPSALPSGKKAIYLFKLGGEYLKIGKVGSKSSARYASHHYNPKSSGSNLASSLLLDDIGMQNVGKWIRENTTRINLLVDDDTDPHVVSLLESFLHCRLRPRYEGR